MRVFKVTALLVIMFLTGVSVEAQEHKVRYFSRSGVKEVTAPEAHFFEIQEENETGGGMRTRFLVEDSTKVRQFTYSDLDGGEYKTGIMDGPYYEWHKNGNVKVQATYSNDRLIGEYKSWYESGKLHYKRKYRDNLPQDTLIAYYETGDVRRVEVYDGGKMVSGKLFDEAGGEMEFFPMEQMPEFPGGEQKMLNWLSRNIKYPKSMRKEKVQGLVVLSYVVEENGSIGEVEVVKELHPAADAEAVRMLNSMPAWKPGLQEGKPIDVRYTLPINYAFD
ncbi:TonB family protein [Pontibacter diazotrophicus]|uniref:TonB family protein n=1 Tax=Pontibacter diazotrophicus TaxID=1400979 RepID=A0A3D8LAB5_9BACT|nr:energy transducer TonB [Pontibacter diazotrophicus]RDV14371.1 TonB family protein [Pontibacter diazotrophicus]